MNDDYSPREAYNDFIRELGNALGLYKVLDWMVSKLNK